MNSIGYEPQGFSRGFVLAMVGVVAFWVVVSVILAWGL